MRLRVKHPAGIDGIACGAVGEFPENDAVRGLIDAGLLARLDREHSTEGPTRVVHAAQDELDALRAQFDAAWADREERIGHELAALREDLRASEALRGAAEARVTELEVEIAQLKLDLEAATAPKA